MRFKLWRVHIVPLINTMLRVSHKSRGLFWLGDISDHTWNGVCFWPFQLWQLTLKIDDISCQINRRGCLSILNKFAYFLLFDPGHRHQKISQQFILSPKMSFWGKRTCILRAKFNFSGASLQAIIDHSFKWRGFHILLMMVNFIQNVKSHESLISLQ